MNGKDCEYCGYAYCECGEAYKPVWVLAKERLPDDGVWVLWHNPDKSWCPILVAKRDGKSLDWGGDLSMPAEGWTHWMNLPEPPIINRRNKNR